MPATTGDFGVMPGHVPTVAQLRCAAARTAPVAAPAGHQLEQGWGPQARRLMRGATARPAPGPARCSPAAAVACSRRTQPRVDSSHCVLSSLLRSAVAGPAW